MITIEKARARRGGPTVSYIQLPVLLPVSLPYLRARVTDGGDRSDRSQCRRKSRPFLAALPNSMRVGGLAALRAVVKPLIISLWRHSPKRPGLRRPHVADTHNCRGSPCHHDCLLFSMQKRASTFLSTAKSHPFPVCCVLQCRLSRATRASVCLECLYYHVEAHVVLRASCFVICLKRRSLMASGRLASNSTDRRRPIFLFVISSLRD